jgi:uncharacterized damage-inducible protein DinB
MQKEECFQLINQKYDALIKWTKDHDDDKFEISERVGKWTTGQHIEHLILSTKPINKAIRLPKMILKMNFGTMNRPERTMAENNKKYASALASGTVVAPSKYDPAFISIDQKKEKIAILDKERTRLIKALNKWSEEDLSTYVLPHPVLGKMSIRELLYFTAYHTQHHLNTLMEHH